VQRVVDRQPDRPRLGAEVVDVDLRGDPAAAQPGPHPEAAEVVGRVGARQGTSELEPGHLDRHVAGQQDAVLERDDVDVVQHRHGKCQPAQLEGVRCLHPSTVPTAAPRQTHPAG
jgi:hypothetical protein